MKIENSKGEVFYGMHFYPGVARYEKGPDNDFTVFLNENTIRKMGTTFAGRPVFVEHVEDVEQDVNELRKEADGWVIESFFNQADGKNWVKFIVVTDKGMQAIKDGFKLSNCYFASQYGPGNIWNGVPYEKEVTDGEFEHLAIVQNPRYEESVIMTPEQFKRYNNDKEAELKKFANSKDNKNKGDKVPKFNIFKRTKVENSMDITDMVVELPKSKKEVLLTKCVDEYDKLMNMNGYANGDHMVKVGEDEMSVNDLVKKHMETCNSLADMEKAKNAASEDGGEPGEDDEDPAMENDTEADIEKTQMEDVGDRGGDESLKNEDDEDADDEDKKKKAKNKKSNSMSVAEAQRVLAKAKAARLKNAHSIAGTEDEGPRISLPRDQVARGKSLYGSGK